MNASEDSSRKSAPDSRSVSEIERDLASTRLEFSETLLALGDKLDVKTRAKNWTRETADQTKDWARETAGQTQHRAQELIDATQRNAKVLINERGRELAIAGSAVGAVVLATLIGRARKR